MASYRRQAGRHCCVTQSLYPWVSKREAKTLPLAQLHRRQGISERVSSWQCWAGEVRLLSRLPPAASSAACPAGRSRDSCAACLLKMAARVPRFPCWPQEKPHLQKVSSLRSGTRRDHQRFGTTTFSTKLPLKQISGCARCGRRGDWDSNLQCAGSANASLNSYCKTACTCHEMDSRFLKVQLAGKRYC